MLAFCEQITYKLFYISVLSSLSPHAARRLLECNIVNIECKKCGKSTFWMFLAVTSLTGVYLFLWDCVSKMLADFFQIIYKNKLPS